MSAAPRVKGARDRARAEITAAIKREARRQLAADGAAKLSLRAVAREVGMVSSALYRYFPSRDDLLTALIVDAYDAIGSAAERALSDNKDAPPTERWVAVCTAARAWAVDHPHEYALIYGSPVPGYTAPQVTVGPAGRVARTLITVMRDAHVEGDQELTADHLSPELRHEAVRMAADFSPELPPAAVLAVAAAWAQLFGLISFEVFGHYNRVIEERDAVFAHAAARLAREVGITAT